MAQLHSWGTAIKEGLSRAGVEKESAGRHRINATQDGLLQVCTGEVDLSAILEGEPTRDVEVQASGAEHAQLLEGDGFRELRRLGRRVSGQLRDGSNGICNHQRVRKRTQSRADPAEARGDDRALSHEQWQRRRRE